MYILWIHIKIQHTFFLMILETRTPGNETGLEQHNLKKWLKTNDLLFSLRQCLSIIGWCVPSMLLAALRMFNNPVPTSAAAGLAAPSSCSSQAKLLTQLWTMKQQHRKMPSASEISDKLQDPYRGQWLAGPQS